MILSNRVAALIAIGLIPVAVSPTPATLGLWLLFVLALTTVDLILAPSPRKLTITREPIKSVRAGEKSASVVRVSGATKKIRGALRDAWQPSSHADQNRHDFTLAPGQTLTFTTELAPSRRGVLKADSVTVRSWGPMRLSGVQTTFDLDGSIRVLPEFPSRAHLGSALAKLQLATGQILSRRRGQGTEFDSLREWVEGDDQRSIDWRATARSNEVIVRTWRPEQDRHIVMVLDTSRMSAQRLGNQTRLDVSMDASLLLAALTAKAGDSVSMIAADSAVRAQVIRPPRTTVLSELSNAMVPLDPSLVEADWGRIGAKITEFGNKVSLVVLFTALDVTVLEESLLPVLLGIGRRTRIVIAHATDPSLFESSRQDDVYFAAATEAARLERERATASLASAGVTVVEALPDELPMKVVDHYLDLKSRGLL
ncbi:MAG: DUF58 domain-containing protein [Actinomycetaceae bacterium]|nr:DUF58 domain-containing protein [Actinomycetaceae bacterium]